MESYNQFGSTTGDSQAEHQKNSSIVDRVLKKVAGGSVLSTTRAMKQVNKGRVKSDVDVEAQERRKPAKKQRKKRAL